MEKRISEREDLWGTPVVSRTREVVCCWMRFRATTGNDYLQKGMHRIGIANPQKPPVQLWRDRWRTSRRISNAYGRDIRNFSNHYENIYSTFSKLYWDTRKRLPHQSNVKIRPCYDSILQRLKFKLCKSEMTSLLPLDRGPGIVLFYSGRTLPMRCIL